MTIDFEVLCEDCALSQGVIRVRVDLTVEVKRDRLVIQRGEVGGEVFPGEIRHLANPPAEAAARLVDQKVQDQSLRQLAVAGERAALGSLLERKYRGEVAERT